MYWFLDPLKTQGSRAHTNRKRTQPPSGQKWKCRAPKNWLVSWPSSKECMCEFEKDLLKTPVYCAQTAHTHKNEISPLVATNRTTECRKWIGAFLPRRVWYKCEKKFGWKLWGFLCTHKKTPELRPLVATSGIVEHQNRLASGHWSKQYPISNHLR